jgi:formylglycine-generating enzyme required for sulfatase activity
MVSGRPPFRAPSTLAVLKRVAEEPPRPIPQIIPETPDWLCGIITKLQAKDPDKRFQSAREVVDLLADCESQLKANSKLKDYSRIPRGQARLSGRRKWVAAAVILLLPVIALAVTELADVTHLFRGQQAANNPLKNGDRPVAKGTKPTWQGWPADGPPPAVAPFDAAQAKKHQEAWAKYLGVPVEYKNSIGMKFRLIPPGEFLMGSTPEEIEAVLKVAADEERWRERIQSEAPRHRVRITKAFQIGVHEVTRGQFRAFVKATGYKTEAEQDGKGGYGFLDGWVQNPKFVWSGDSGFDTGPDDEHPVCQVTWNDARAFCAWLTKQKGVVYRLPTEAEWEYACRAGTMTRWHSGNDDRGLKDYAWSAFQGGRGTRPVGTRRSNAFGLGDMHGNLWEWCSDWHRGDFYRGSPAMDPVGPSSGTERVLRGGNWYDGASQSRSACRLEGHPSFRDYSIGFRVVLPVDALKEKLNDKPAPLPPYKNSIGMEFVRVPKGKAWLGGSKDKLGDEEVKISADFYLGKYEVTQEEWEKVMGENPSHFSRAFEGRDAVKDVSNTDLKRLPVESVSWDDCQAFVARLNQREKESGWVYRLPTAVEWEYACRGGPMSNKRDSGFDFYFTKPANTLLPEQANFNMTIQRTVKVGSYPPNRLGLFDMHGNVWEWCQDEEKDEDGKPRRVTRGGCWTTNSGFCQAAFHLTALPTDRNVLRGVRLARVPSGAAVDQANGT